MKNLEGVGYVTFFRLNIFKLLCEWVCKTRCFYLEKKESSPSHLHSLVCHKKSRCFALSCKHFILSSVIMWFQRGIKRWNEHAGLGC